MLREVVAAAALGLALLWLVLQPLLAPGRRRSVAVEPLDPEETPKGIALTALKEIEFDRETGKLSDVDYEQLKAKYTSSALDALRAEEADGAPNDVETLIAARVESLRSARASTPLGVPVPSLESGPSCQTCGPRPEPDALFCSTCGAALNQPSACTQCGAPLAPGSNFCEACGSRVAA